MVRLSSRGAAKTPTLPGTYVLTEYAVPEADRSKFGVVWYQMGADSASQGLHGWPNFKPGYENHACVRVSQMTLTKLKNLNPTILEIVK